MFSLYLSEDAYLRGLLVDIVGDGGDARVHCYLSGKERGGRRMIVMMMMIMMVMMMVMMMMIMLMMRMRMVMMVIMLIMIDHSITSYYNCIHSPHMHDEMYE